MTAGSLSHAPPHPTVHRLLGHPADLAGHLATHGPLFATHASLESWAAAFAHHLNASGLVGRGGGAFPTARKLAASRTGGTGGTIVVNGMEGEPASDKDKVLLTRAPHLVLDGAQYLAVAGQADRVVVCVPVGRDHVAAAVQRAIEERSAAGHAPTVESVERPPDRFVAGEESALANWLQSGHSLPVFRPDKRRPLRIGKRTALIHNAETLAHLGLIARHGSAPFLARGLPEEPGTCLVTIGGSVAQPGVVEVDRGTPLLDIAHLSRPTGPVQALLVGGYGGAWVSPDQSHTPYASIPLRTIGAGAGVGVIIVLGATACGVAETARIAHYLAGQSAGQCGPCVYGLPAIADDLARLAQGRVDPDLMPRLHRRLYEVDGRGACRHPDGAVALVRSALSVFGTDVTAHQHGQPCPHHRQPSILRLPPTGSN